MQKLQMSISGPVLGQRTFLHAQLYGVVRFRVILKKFHEIKVSNLQQMFSSWFSFIPGLYMIMLNCSFIIVAGWYGQWKIFTTHLRYLLKITNLLSGSFFNVFFFFFFFFKGIKLIIILKQSIGLPYFNRLRYYAKFQGIWSNSVHKMLPKR